MMRLVVKVLIFGLSLVVAEYGLSTKVNYLRLGGNDQTRAVERVAKVDQPEIIYFSDSVGYTVAKTDTDKRSIPDMISDGIPGISIEGIMTGAYGVEVFNDYSHYILRHYRPKVVIMPINLRSFSAEWNKRPQYQFTKERLYLKGEQSPWIRFFYRPLSTYTNIFMPVTEKDYQNVDVYNGDNKVGKVADFLRVLDQMPNIENTRKSLEFFYMYRLDQDHQKMKLFRSLVGYLESRGVRVILYITPIDYQLGDELWGAQFSQRISENVMVISEELAKDDIEVLDWSRTLPAKNFSYVKYPNEHLNQEGRLWVADKLEEQLATIFAN